MLSEAKLSSFAVVAAPQHIMNLAQAMWANVVKPDVECIVLHQPGESASYNSAVLAGTRRYFERVEPRIYFREKRLSRFVANFQIAVLVRKGPVLQRQASSLVSGAHPSLLWTRSRIHDAGGCSVILDDGDVALEPEFDEVVRRGGMRIGIPLYEQMLLRLAGPKRNSPSILMYSHLAKPSTSVPVIQHEYRELATRLIADPPEELEELKGRRVWIDSNFTATIGATAHKHLLAHVVETFGIDAIVPHRRTPMAWIGNVSHELGLQVVRPLLPIEMVVGRWTSDGCELYSPPASATLTARFFCTAPGTFVTVPISDWLVRQGEEGESSPNWGHEVRRARLLEGHFQDLPRGNIGQCSC